MKKKNEILWSNDGWTVIRNADAEKHLLEISCLAKNGIVTEVRKRHNDGEEIRLDKKVDDTHTLPMPLADFRAAIENDELKLK